MPVKYLSNTGNSWQQWSSRQGYSGAVDAYWRQKRHSTNPSMGMAWQTITGREVVSRSDGELVFRGPGEDPPNSWSDVTPPTLSGIDFVQHVSSIFAQGRHYVVGRFYNGTYYRAWIAYTENDGATWSWMTLFITANVETFPIWLAEDRGSGAYLWMTVIRSGTLYVLRIAVSTMTISGSEISMGSATPNGVLARTDWCAVEPAWGDAARLWVYGRLSAVPGLSAVERHVVLSTNTGSTWSQVAAWNTGDVCLAMMSLPDRGSGRWLTAVRVEP